jgi:outer membrane protein TolC
MRSISKIAYLTILIALAQVNASVLTLEDAVREALLSSTQTKIFDEKLVSSREFENEQRGLLYPNISVYADAGRGAMPVDTRPFGGAGIVNQSANAFDYGIKATGPIYTFGKLSTAISMAKLKDESVRLQVKRGKQDLQMQVIDAYSAVVLAQAKVQVLRRSRDRSKETFTLLERDFTAGKGMKADVLMAKSSLKSLEPQIIAAERDADAARRNLNRLLGRPSQDVTPLDTTAMFASLEEDQIPDSQVAFDNAQKDRADLKSLEVASKVYAGTSTIFQANYYPTIGYMGKFGIKGSEVGQMVDWVQREWMVGVGMTWNVFDGWGKDGANKAKVASWKSDARVFDYQASELRRGIEIEIESAIRDRAAADTSLAATQEGCDAAREAVSLLKANYPGGMARLSDVLSAEDGLRNAELGLLAAHFNRTRAMAKLRIVVGRDLVPISEEK